jgi:D-ornithine 4,5-aminomutase subunit alpha
MRERVDDFQQRRKHLADLSEQQLEARFWELADKLTQPLVDLAWKHTSPSIERSVLLRMGLSSIESQAVVSRAIDAGLIGKGAGHIVYKLSQSRGMGIREAGQALAEGRYWDEASALFQAASAGSPNGGKGGGK